MYNVSSFRWFINTKQSYPNQCLKVDRAEWLSTIIMVAAQQLPKKIAISAFLILMLNKAAIADPVHTPVVGNGMATKMNKPSIRYFFIFLLFFMTLLVMASANLLPIRVFLNQAIRGLNNNNINGTGTILPRMPKAAAWYMFIPIETPNGIATFNSANGSIAIKKTVNSRVKKSK